MCPFFLHKALQLRKPGKRGGKGKFPLAKREGLCYKEKDIVKAVIGKIAEKLPYQRKNAIG